MNDEHQKKVLELLFAMSTAADEVINISEVFHLSINEAFSYWKDSGEDSIDTVPSNFPGKRMLKYIYEAIPEMCFYKSSGIDPDEYTIERWEETISYFVLVRDTYNELQQIYKQN